MSSPRLTSPVAHRGGLRKGNSMRCTSSLLVPRRVRELYIAFIVLAPELESICVDSSSGMIGRRWQEQSFFRLRLDCAGSGGHASDGSAADGASELTPVGRAVVNAVKGEMLPNASAASVAPSDPPAASTLRQRRRRHEYGCTYRVRREDCAQLDPYLPPNWRNNRASPGCAAAPTSPAPSPSSSSLAAFSLRYRAYVQERFYECALLRPGDAGGGEWKRSLARGRVELRSLQETIHMKKYRAMRKRYDWAAQLSNEDLLAALDAQEAEENSRERLRQAQIGLGNRDTYGYKLD